MKVKHALILFSISLLTLLLVQCSPKKLAPADGVVTFKLGESNLVREGKTLPVELQTEIRAGDKIITAEKGVVIIVFRNNSAKIEIQPNTEYTLDKFDEQERLMTMTKGNAWLWSEKLQKGSKLQMRTPNTVAGVRGTKFFTFNMGEITGTCHCEGDVEFSNKSGNYSGVHHKHYMVFVKENKTVALTDKELIAMGFPIREEHQHSLLDDSPLGPQKQDIPPELMEKLMAHLTKEFDK